MGKKLTTFVFEESIYTRFQQLYPRQATKLFEEYMLEKIKEKEGQNGQNNKEYND